MNPSAPSSFLRFPGGEYVEKGLADLDGGRESIPAFLLAIAAQRLKAAGLSLPGTLPRDPELRLYQMLQDFHGDGAHSQFNACLRRLASLCQTLEQSSRHESTLTLDPDRDPAPGRGVSCQP